jgi:hypothetical protein
MNSDQRLRLSGALLGILIASTAGAEPTWRTVAEMNEADRAMFDPANSTPRDSAIPYLPAEAYPFKPPYTAEEMGYRSAEFPHISRWTHALNDVFGVITSTGYINQGSAVSYVEQTTGSGLDGYMRGLAAGDVHSKWLMYSKFPPETEAEQQLWLVYRTDPKITTKMDFFVYSPQMRRVRRQPQPRRDQRFPDNAQTFDDVIGRDPWEMEWQLLGTDVLYQTVRYPDTRDTIVLNRNNKGFVEEKTADIRVMGPEYPHYRPDGGVDCWVVMARIKPEIVPDYNEKYLIFWLDKHYFYPIRTEKYDHQDKLMMVEVRNPRLENAAMPEGFGYAASLTVYWDINHDIMSYSMHDGNEPITWTEEQKGMLFTPEFMRRQWLVKTVKTQALIQNPDHYFMRPHLDPEKFPDVRHIEISPELQARIAAQDSAGHLVFDGGAAPAGGE